MCFIDTSLLFEAPFAPPHNRFNTTLHVYFVAYDNNPEQFPEHLSPTWYLSTELDLVCSHEQLIEFSETFDLYEGESDLEFSLLI